MGSGRRTARFFVSFAISAALCAKRTVQQLWRPALFQGRRRPPALPPAGILPSPVRRARPFFHNPVMPDRPPPAKRQPVQARFPVLASVGGHRARRGQKAATGTALRPCPLHLSLCPDRVRQPKSKAFFFGGAKQTPSALTAQCFRRSFRRAGAVPSA